MAINRKAQKIVSIEKVLWDTMTEANRDLDAEWLEHMDMENSASHGRTRKHRMVQRLLDGRAIKPCGRECHEWGFAIIKTYDHKSMKNSKVLVNDKEFLLLAMTVTPSPRECVHFFYDYINPYLKKNKEFRLNLLRAMFKNVHIFERADIEYFVEKYHFEKEYECIKNDESFKQYLMQVFEPKCEMPESLTKWNNIEEKKEKRRYRKSITRIHNENQARFNDQMKCFEGEQEEEKDPLEDFFNSEFTVE